MLSTLTAWLQRRSPSEGVGEGDAKEKAPSPKDTPETITRRVVRWFANERYRS